MSFKVLTMNLTIGSQPIVNFGAYLCWPRKYLIAPFCTDLYATIFPPSPLVSRNNFLSVINVLSFLFITICDPTETTGNCRVTRLRCFGLSAYLLSICLLYVEGLRFPSPPCSEPPAAPLHKPERATVTRPPLYLMLGATVTHGFPHFCMQPAQPYTQ